jgi:hypothetical protein
VVGPGITRGSSTAPPGTSATTPSPVKPVSEAPIASVTSAAGNSSMYCRFTTGEKSAPLELIEPSEEPS